MSSDFHSHPAQSHHHSGHLAHTHEFDSSASSAQRWHLPHRFSRRMLLAAGGFWATVFLGRKYDAIAQTHPLYSNQVKIYTQGGVRYIVANGIPNHATGTFPNQHNPNRIQPQNERFQMPAHPQVAAQVTPAHGRRSGVALNGIVFDPGTAELWQGDRNWRYEALSGKIDLGLDANNAHVQPDGTYHYHGLPIGLIAKLGHANTMVMVGYAADGFPMYAQYGYTEPLNPKSGLKKMRSSYRLKTGSRSSGPGGLYEGTFTQDYEYVRGLGDLDECNGHFGATPEHPQGIYHYFITDTFPIITRTFRGVPDPSFQHGGPLPGQGRSGTGQDRPGMMPPHLGKPPKMPSPFPPSGFPPGPLPGFPPGPPPF
ncbi:MAG TPA: YHYH protein [Stenomitos sp.]